MTEDDDRPSWQSWAIAILFPQGETGTRAALYGRVAVYLVLVVWGVSLMVHGIDADRLGGSFMHWVNLPFHEAGHVFFSFFGRFIGILGGSAGQLLMPTVCLVTMLFKTRDAFGASVCLWWLAESHLDLAPYIYDARAQRLMLIGDVTGRESGMHDWNNILTDLNWLMRDHAIAQGCFAIGAILMLASFVWGGLALWRQHRELAEE